jgi:hypothetical protein
LNVTEPNSTEGLKISFSIPKTESAEYEHWRLLAQLRLVRATHDGRPGLGKNGGRIEGIKSKGWDFLELSRDDALWDQVLHRCAAASASSFPMVMNELRREARLRICSKR